MVSSVRERVPPHLRGHVVEQDYAAYDEIDQAVWRFTLRHTHAVLKRAAHPAYLTGLGRAGIDLERIPQLGEMDRRLSAYGWRVVGVDGFIPPRAFQELQACGILPVAVDIRTADHLAYTPAPDIIHEAAGHAPLLIEPAYGAFLRRIGQVGYRAFARPHDHAVYQAIFALSVIKERLDASAAEVRAREQALADAIAVSGGVSEAAQVARLYWWTVEYGLIGTVADYRIYGAGLLSSLGESHSCQRPEVEKRRLDERCLEVDYDITRAQPQLFVADSFEHLGEVLAKVEAGLSQARGGLSGLTCALASEEIATLRFANGLTVSGRVTHVAEHDGSPIELLLAPGWTLSQPTLNEQNAPPLDPAAARDPLKLWFAPSARHERGGAVSLTLPDSRRAAGRRGQVLRAANDHLLAWELLGEQAPLSWWVVEEGQIVSVAAGPAHAAAPEALDEAPRLAPRIKPYSAEHVALLELYERAHQAFDAQLGPACLPLFETLHARLLEAHPREWLLRWHLLESLTALGERSRLTQELVTELLALEHVYNHAQPIATGLSALDPSFSDAFIA